MSVMGSGSMMALTNLRRRKGQGLLVGAIIGLSALLCFTGIGVLLGISRPVVAMFARQHGSHFTMLFDSRIHDIDSVRAWWMARPEVAAVTEALPVLDLRERAYFRGRELGALFEVTERPRRATDQDILRIVDGKAANGPGPGEVWLPTALAQDAGITAGDTLDLPTATGLEPFVVGAIVVDPQFSSPFNNPTRIWLGAGELASHFQSPRLSRVLVGVRLADARRSEQLWEDFVRHLGGVYSGAVYNYQAVMDGYTTPYAMMAAMIMAFSALGFLVALFAIQGTITSSILADFKTIGILRAQGFRPQDVRRIYEIQ